MHHRVILPVIFVLAMPNPASASGTPAGTNISSQVEVDYEISGQPHSGLSNIVTVAVAEVIEFDVLVQTPQRLVGTGVSAQPLYFTVTNTGNGTETLNVSPIVAITGDDFDPVIAAAAIVFDADGDGSVSVTDPNYVPGTNDPVLVADESMGAFLVADIPPGLADGQLGFAELHVASLTATGNPGEIFPGLGDAGVDVVLGPGGGQASARGEYLIGEISLSLTKVAVVSSPQGDQRPVPGALLTYTIQVAALGTGSAGSALFTDAIPQYTQFVPGSLRLNGQPLSDAADADSGEFRATPPEVFVQLGDLQAGDPAQVVEFTVSIE